MLVLEDFQVSLVYRHRPSVAIEHLEPTLQRTQKTKFISAQVYWKESAGGPDFDIKWCRPPNSPIPVRCDVVSIRPTSKKPIDEGKTWMSASAPGSQERSTKELCGKHLRRPRCTPPRPDKGLGSVLLKIYAFPGLVLNQDFMNTDILDEPLILDEPWLVFRFEFIFAPLPKEKNIKPRIYTLDKLEGQVSFLDCSLNGTSYNTFTTSTLADKETDDAMPSPSPSQRSASRKALAQIRQNSQYEDEEYHSQWLYVKPNKHSEDASPGFVEATRAAYTPSPFSVRPEIRTTRTAKSFKAPAAGTRAEELDKDWEGPFTPTSSAPVVPRAHRRGRVAKFWDFNNATSQSQASSSVIVRVPSKRPHPESPIVISSDSEDHDSNISDPSKRECELKEREKTLQRLQLEIHKEKKRKMDLEIENAKRILAAIKQENTENEK